MTAPPVAVAARRCHAAIAAPSPLHPPPFEPYIPAGGAPSGADGAAADPRHAARRDLRRLLALPGAQGRAHGQRVDSGRGHLDHAVPAVLEAGRTRRHDSREQHRADGGLGGRVDRLRPRRDDAGDHDSRLRPGDHARRAGRRARRPARHPDDDSAAPRAHRAAARDPEVSRRHGLRRGAEGRRLGRVARRVVAVGQARARGARRRGDQRHDHLHRLRHRPRLQGAERRLQGLEGRAAEDLRRAVRGRLDLGGDFARAARRRLHHRPAHRRRRCAPAACSRTWC